MNPRRRWSDGLRGLTLAMAVVAYGRTASAAPGSVLAALSSDDKSVAPLATEAAPSPSVDSVSEHPLIRSVADSMIAVEVGGAAAGRSFAYSDGLTKNLRTYNVLPAAMFTVHAEVFPLAGMDLTGAGRILADLGVIGGLGQSILLESSVPGGSTVSTSESSYLVGLRLRIHPWGREGAVLGVSDAYALQSFTFGASDVSIAAQFPSVSYTANRIAVDARIPIGKFAVLAGAGYRAVQDAGNVAQRFRLAAVGGVDAEFGGAFAIANGWEGRLVADYERYFYAFSPVPGDVYVAGGALDQFFGARIGLAWIY